MLRFLQFFFFLNIIFLYFGCNINKTEKNWRTINTNKTNHLYGVHFFDKKHGWAVGSDNLILKTDDSGLTWVEISKPNALFSGPIKKVHFSTQNHGWIIGLRGKILYTTNGGKSWVKQNSNLQSGLLDLFFTSKSEGWIVGGHGKILHLSLIHI